MRSRRRGPRLRHSAWFPFVRLDVDGRRVGIAWRESGVWFSAPWEGARATPHTTRGAAVRCLLTSHGLEGADLC